MRPGGAPDTPPMIQAYMAQRSGPAQVDALLEALRLHLTYGPYAGWKDTIRADVAALTVAWQQYRDEREEVPE